jgi:sulfide:quinone oxidoreductase
MARLPTDAKLRVSPAVKRKRIVILGGGTGGTITANRLRRRFPVEEADICVVDRDDEHVYQPGLLFVPFGLADPAKLVRSRRRQLRGGIRFHQAEVDSVALAEDTVRLSDGAVLPYDVLVVASGTSLAPEETEGLAWSENVHTFYELERAVALRDALRRFEGGRLVVDIVDMPIKCPVAPIEFAFLADWSLRKRGLRSRSQIVLATPLDACFTKPIASRHLTHLLTDRGIDVEAEFSAGEVDGAGGRLVSYDGRELAFDFLVAVPLHGGAPYVTRSDGLGDALGFVPVDPHSLQARAKPNVFALGDAADLPTSKAGSAVHFQSDLLVENVARFLESGEVAAAYDGHVNCFIETGNHKALLIDFNYDLEPVPGRYPAAFGLPLLRESRLDHLGKLAFEQLYWHALLPGRNLPGIHTTMPRAGKRIPAGAAAGKAGATT